MPRGSDLAGLERPEDAARGPGQDGRVGVFQHRRPRDDGHIDVARRENLEQRPQPVETDLAVFFTGGQDDEFVQARADEAARQSAVESAAMRQLKHVGKRHTRLFGVASRVEVPTLPGVGGNERDPQTEPGERSREVRRDRVLNRPGGRRDDDRGRQAVRGDARRGERTVGPFLRRAGRREGVEEPSRSRRNRRHDDRVERNGSPLRGADRMIEPVDHDGRHQREHEPQPEEQQ